ncbi:Mannose-1-phosphate guanylyltransferase [Bacillus sp. 349Y]|nr:Mannose-1-phosphate guanylyltransferase [Bacillus sp. 349Y]
MKLVLLSGGSGKRLWPLSNDTRSKQFLKVLEGEGLERESMLQRVWRQISHVGLADSTVIATSKLQKEIIQNQLETDIPIIIEPERRDTFPAIALAASYLYSLKEVSVNETVIVLPVDPYVESDYFGKMKELDKVIQDENIDLGLIGIKPTYPSSKYGYIVPNNSTINSERIIHVEKFIEKPDEERAKSLLKENALWNAGVFGFKLGYLIDIMNKKNVPTTYDELLREYKNLPKISFDYEVVENAQSINAITYDGYWKDLGTWNTLTEEMSTNQIGRGVISSDSVESHLINELDIPVTVLGVKNVIVAASSDGILVSEKNSSPYIKEYIKDFTQPPMYEEKLWGWIRTLDYANYDKEHEMVTKRLGIKEGKNLSYQYHKHKSKIWTVVQGEGELALDEKISKIKRGDIIHLSTYKKHALYAISDIELIEVQTGIISEEDCVELIYDWKEIYNNFINSNSMVYS